MGSQSSTTEREQPPTKLMQPVGSRGPAGQNTGDYSIYSPLARRVVFNPVALWCRSLHSIHLMDSPAFIQS